MKHSHFTKLLAALLALFMLTGTFAVAASAEEYEDNPVAATDAADAGENFRFFGDEELSQIVKAYNYPYEYYVKDHASDPKGTDEIVIDATKYIAEDTTADVKVVELDGEPALYSPVNGEISYKFTVKTAGKYTFKLRYYQTDSNVDGETTIVERGMKIDGDYPFSETRILYFPRLWKYVYDENGNFRKDKNGNDFRPVRVEDPQWTEYYVRDWLGYEAEPFEIYLDSGEHEVTFIGSREPVYYGKILIAPAEDVPTYEEFIADCKAKGIQEITDGETLTIQGEKPDTLSIQTILPVVDRTSCFNDPQDAANLLYNCITATGVNQFVIYHANVEKEGLYKISVRYRQNGLIGMFCSRKIFINGEQQFLEAARCRFVYSPYWQTDVLNNGSTEFLFYLKAGENEIKMETVLGDFAQYCYEVRNLADELMEVYYKIVKIAGLQPDPYRNYGFKRVMPEIFDTMAIAAKRLNEIADIFIEMTGEISEPTAMLQQAALIYDEMANDEYKIAGDFITYKKYVTALYDWVNTCMNQKILIDKIVIQPINGTPPKARANMFEQMWFECKAFVASFFMDYTSIGFAEDTSSANERHVTLWSSVSSAAAREQMLILRQYTDSDFTPKTGIDVKIEVISAGLTEAILAGMGPDIAFMDSSTAVSWGLRTGVENLAGMPGMDEVYDEFGDALMEGVKINDKIYGLPVAFAYNAVFYRADILKELKLEVPKTWDDITAILPLLQNQNMEIGLSYWLTGAAASSVLVNQLANPYILIQQSGGAVYADNGMRAGVDTPETLAAFEKWCDFYAKYGTQPTFDITRFRLGEVPIVVGDLTTIYNTLMGFNEIRGLWGIAPIFATEKEDGTFDRSNIVMVTNCIVIPRGCDDVDAAWEYLKWYAGYDGQSVLTRETISVSTPTTKVGTANLKVLLEEPWTDRELTVVKDTLDGLVGIANYPGAYLVNAQISFAFLSAYSEKADAGISLLDRINTMNKELSRKRQEYGLDYYLIDYTGQYSEDKIVYQEGGH